MRQPPVVPHHPPPGPLPGAVLGVVAGLILASIWLYGARDVALAVTAVFLGLAAVVLGGAPDWRPFGTGLVGCAVVAAAALVALAEYT